ncbi:MAG TPA: cation:proton antiporter, partial [Arenibaculum sp.]|nr:cation:proton antiporter [Arenibaculum sp.]
MPDTGHLSDVLVLLLAAIVVVPVLQRIGIAPVLGYLAAGVAIGPFALRLVHDLEATQIVAEFGVVFLLFSIGMELPLSRLRAMRRYIFGLGLAQVAVTTLVLALAAYLLGLPAETAVLAGGAFAMSSTAVVIRMLVDR